jgi:hypothetical protein
MGARTSRPAAVRHERATSDNSERLREMRDHVGVDPTAIVAGTVPANRADRRLAARVLRKQARTDSQP